MGTVWNGDKCKCVDTCQEASTRSPVEDTTTPQPDVPPPTTTSSPNPYDDYGYGDGDDGETKYYDDHDDAYGYGYHRKGLRTGYTYSGGHYVYGDPDASPYTYDGYGADGPLYYGYHKYDSSEYMAAKRAKLKLRGAAHV